MILVITQPRMAGRGELVIDSAAATVTG